MSPKINKKFPACIVSTFNIGLTCRSHVTSTAYTCSSAATLVVQSTMSSNTQSHGALCPWTVTLCTKATKAVHNKVLI